MHTKRRSINSSNLWIVQRSISRNPQDHTTTAQTSQKRTSASSRPSSDSTQSTCSTSNAISVTFEAAILLYTSGSGIFTGTSQPSRTQRSSRTSRTTIPAVIIRSIRIALRPWDRYLISCLWIRTSLQLLPLSDRRMSPRHVEQDL